MSRKRRVTGAGCETSASAEHAGRCHSQTNSSNMHEASFMGSDFFGNSVKYLCSLTFSPLSLALLLSLFAPSLRAIRCDCMNQDSPL